MTTLAEIRDSLQGTLDRTGLETLFDLAVNKAINHYERENFWFTQTSGTFSTVAGTASYGTADGLPSDIKSIHYAEVTINGADYPLTRRDISWVQEMNPQATQGEPSDYAWWQGKAWLYLVPNAVRTVRLYYTKSYAELTSADENDWTNSARELIEVRARWWLNSYILKDYPAADRDKLEEAEQLLAIRSRNEEIAGGMRVRPTCF